MSVIYLDKDKAYPISDFIGFQLRTKRKVFVYDNNGKIYATIKKNRYTPIIDSYQNANNFLSNSPLLSFYDPFKNTGTKYVIWNSRNFYPELWTVKAADVWQYFETSGENPQNNTFLDFSMKKLALPIFAILTGLYLIKR